MLSAAKSLSPGSAEEKRFLFESQVKDSFGDFREMCLNFRSSKHKPNFEEEIPRSVKRSDKKSSSFKLQVRKVGVKIKDFFVKDQKVTNVNVRRLVLFTTGMLFLEFLLCSLAIFLLWVIPGAYSQMREINWVVLLITAIILGLLMAVEYFLQKYETLLKTRFLLKIPELGLQIFVFAYCADNYHPVFLSLWYMVALGLLITWVFFFFMNKISYWLLIINIVLVIVDFFFLFSQLGAWYYCMPIFIVTLYLIMILSYEIKMLTDLADFQSLIAGDLDRLTLSYSLALYKDAYVAGKQKLMRQESDAISAMQRHQTDKR